MAVIRLFKIMPINKLFPRGTASEQSMIEGLIIESIRQYGREFYYLPRKLNSLDHLFGEDPLSSFENAYQIEGYLDNVDNYGGNGMFMSKFGMFIEEQGQITIARKRWERLVSAYGETIIPSRPAEGDLIYFPTTKGLFEIKFVEHQNPFYQLGRLYVYKLKVELFQFSSERFETQVEDINNMALDMTFDILNDSNQEAEPIKRNSFDNTYLQTEAGTGDDILNFDQSNPFGE